MGIRAEGFVCVCVCARGCGRRTETTEQSDHIFALWFLWDTRVVSDHVCGAPNQCFDCTASA